MSIISEMEFKKNIVIFLLFPLMFLMFHWAKTMVENRIMHSIGKSFKIGMFVHTALALY